eukprot:CAMPEP_0175087068 /NCGR_PEP_ID=MMETSP0052_2-20121109/29622_1 /TAXON_ID=51329 ORGANISM="Polytomella parva, Strain SAG 63-3" /NCGR_SAMPLE_ID=MMETSP0052_2 /ASSEMBLY_ACC=CAM_ASM_000194 /LENGTH=372 /DNA_ID=CAMNT_0016359367 /DNA_START=54 /DNA_END=1169 /DNA_ORIENTATION=-
MQFRFFLPTLVALVALVFRFQGINPIDLLFVGIDALRGIDGEARAPQINVEKILEDVRGRSDDFKKRDAAVVSLLYVSGSSELRNQIRRDDVVEELSTFILGEFQRRKSAHQFSSRPSTKSKRAKNNKKTSNKHPFTANNASTSSRVSASDNSFELKREESVIAAILALSKLFIPDPESVAPVFSLDPATQSIFSRLVHALFRSKGQFSKREKGSKGIDDRGLDEESEVGNVTEGARRGSREMRGRGETWSGIEWVDSLLPILTESIGSPSPPDQAAGGALLHSLAASSGLLSPWITHTFTRPSVVVLPPIFWPSSSSSSPSSPSPSPFHGPARAMLRTWVRSHARLVRQVAQDLIQSGALMSQPDAVVGGS